MKPLDLFLMNKKANESNDFYSNQKSYTHSRIFKVLEA